MSKKEADMQGYTTRADGVRLSFLYGESFGMSLCLQVSCSALRTCLFYMFVDR